MVRTRIAPSPTGVAHIGTAYTSLFNFAFARQQKGKFILRIEDTDRSRYLPGSEKIIFEGLRWLGLFYDEGPDIGGPYAPYIQSQRLPLYKKYSQRLVEKGFAYYCFCSPQRLAEMRKEQQKKRQPPRYDGHCRALSPSEAKERVKRGTPFVIRLKVPQKGKTSWNDLVRGRIVFENKVIDDQILLKSDGYPTYHLAVVVDDHLMKISHVIRAEEWISSTPKHILLYQAFGWKIPQFAHLPLLRNPDRSKISKRKNPVALTWYKKEGYLPEAILNFLSLLGWSHPRGKEVFPLSDFIKFFSFQRISKAGPIFDLKKLNWLNGVWIRKKSKKELADLLKPFAPKEAGEALISRTVPLVQDRLVKLSDYSDLVDFLVKEIKYPRKLLFQRGKTKEETREALSAISYQLSVISKKDWKYKKLEQITRKFLAAKLSGWQAGQLFMTLRVAITGKTVTPPLFESMEILGKEKSLERINQAIKKLS